MSHPAARKRAARPTFGVLAMPDRAATFIDVVKTAEAAGYERVRVGDSQTVYREMYICLTLAALNTSRVMIGPGVTNPVTRHPAVTACAMGTLQELSGGRAFLGIGAGDAVHALGLPGATIEHQREYVLAVRDLFTKGEACYQGRAIALTWFRGNVPIYLAAHGPRSLRLAGEIADGVIIGTGLNKEVVEGSLAYLREGAEKAGRRVEDIDVWWWGFANVAATRREAVDGIRMSLAAAGNILGRSTMKGRHIPERYQEPLRQLAAGYLFQQQARPGSKNAERMDQLGLTDYLAERYAFAGRPEECVEQVQRAAQYGASQFFISVHMQDKVAFLRQWADRVMAKL